MQARNNGITEKKGTFMIGNHRQTGSYYTSGEIAEYMSNWGIRSPRDVLLEPSFGEGVFIDKAYGRYQALGNFQPEIHAVEYQESSLLSFLSKNIKGVNTHLSDFLAFGLSGMVDVVLGNPPYVSLKNLPENIRASAIDVIARRSLTIPTNGSLWFPFVVHATSLINPGGRLAFVLPYEITYVQYATELWKFLCGNFSRVTLVRVFEDFFPAVDVETVLLLVDGKGGTTNNIVYKVYQTVKDLIKGNAVSETNVHIRSIAKGAKPFTSALMKDEEARLLSQLRDSGIVEPIANSCKFKIGYVSADKAYFHPSQTTVEQYSIPEENLVPSILNSKEINGGTGVGLSVDAGQCASRLYLPGTITSGDARYIESGVLNGVADKYKCRNRKPWYVTPCVEIPDVILSVFGDVPKLVVNNGGYAASNSLLCGTLASEVDKRDFACRWYNSLTLLSVELNVHSLGGGSLVIIPGEADALSLARALPANLVDSIYGQLEDCICAKGLTGAYRLGDELVLKNVFGMTEKQVSAIRESVNSLKCWRMPNLRRNNRVNN